MTRRDAIRNTIGALVGVSAIPAFGEKPPFSATYATGVRLWKDLACTIPALKHGDIVAVMQFDGMNLFNREPYKRPILKDGSVEFDGKDAFLASSP